MKMKNHQLHGVSNGKKCLKEGLVAKFRTVMRKKKKNGNVRSVKKFGMTRVVIGELFAISVVRSSTFNVQVYDISNQSTGSWTWKIYRLNVRNALSECFAVFVN